MGEARAQLKWKKVWWREWSGITVRKGLLVALPVALLLGTLSAFAEAPWPIFQHDPQHTGRSLVLGPGAIGLPTVEIIPKSNDESDYFTFVAIGEGDTLYVGGRINDKAGIYAISPDLVIEWFFENPDPNQVPCPAIGPDGTIFAILALEQHPSIVALNPDGTLKWQRSFVEGNPRIPLTIDSNGALCFLLEDTSTQLVALESSSGEVKWTYTVESNLPGGPLPCTIGQDGVIYFGLGDTLYAINPDGTEKWRRAFPTIFLDGSQELGRARVTAPSVGDDGTIYVVVAGEKEWGNLMAGGFYSGLHAIDPNNPYSEKWPTKYLDGARGPVTIAPNGNLYVAGTRMPLDVAYGVIYGFSPDGIELEGWPFYRKYAGCKGPLVTDQEGYIYVNFSGEIWAFDPLGNPIWNFHLLEDRSEYGLALDGRGTLYVPGRRCIYAVKREPYAVSSLVQDFSASDGESGQSSLVWTNPPNSDLAQLVVRRKIGAYPSSHNDGDPVYYERFPAPGAQVEYVDTGLTDGLMYYYAVFCYTITEGWNDQVVEGSNADTAIPGALENRPPAPPTNLSQVLSDGTEIAVGGQIDTDTVVFKATLTDPDGDREKLQVELRRLDELGGEFDETEGGLKESGLVASGSEATCSASGLIPAHYHWRARAVDEHGLASEWVEFGNNPTSAADFSVQLPGDTTPPSLIQDFIASDSEDSRSTLSWTNPPDDDLAEVVVRRKTGSYPSDHTDGDVVYRDSSPTPGATVEYADTDLINGTTYYYAVFSRDTAGNWNDQVVEGKNADTATPGLENHPPIARASDISGQPGTMYPGVSYAVTAKYFDPDGRDDLKYCYLRLNHPEKPLTMMWYQEDGHAAPWAGEEGENYLTRVEATATSITDLDTGYEGYEITWTFEINDHWPEVENAIDFGVCAIDDHDSSSGWNHDDTNASFYYARFKPIIIIPPFCPSLIIVHEGSVVSVPFWIRNDGTKKGTVVLDVQESLGRPVELSDTVLDLEPGELHEVYARVVVEGGGSGNIFVTLQYDDASQSSTKVTTIFSETGTGLFVCKLRFTNITDQVAQLIFVVPPYVKLSATSLTLDPQSIKLLTAVFDPSLSYSGIRDYELKVRYDEGEGAIRFEFPVDNLYSTDFDIAIDSYSFSNWKDEKSSGYCFGMSETAILYFLGKIPLPDGAANTFSLTWEAARETIERHQLRFLNKLSDFDWWPWTHADDWYKEIERLIKQYHEPAVIIIEENRTKHAVIAYRVAKRGDMYYIFVYENEFIYSASRLDSVFPYAVYDSRKNTLTYNGNKVIGVWRAKLLPSEWLSSETFLELKGSNSDMIRVVFWCPVYVVITDNYGRSIDSGEISEIPGAQIEKRENEEIIFYLPSNYDYAISFKAYDIGFVSIAIVYPSKYKLNPYTAVFDVFPVSTGTLGTTPLHPDSEELWLELDLDGDGHVDERHKPDFVEGEIEGFIPLGYLVNYGPNPIPPEGCIFWLNLPDDAVKATLKIFDIDGALLVSIPLDPTADRYPEIGRWIPQDAKGRLLGTGLYLYCVEIEHADGTVTYSPVQKMVIQR